MGLGPWGGHIVAGYLISLAVIGAVIWFTYTQSRKVKRSLAELEARGIRRRSDTRPRSDAAAEPRLGPGTSV